MSDVTSQNSNKTASGGASGGIPPSNTNVGANNAPNQGAVTPAPAIIPQENATNSPQPQATVSQKSNVAFHSANITPKKDIFAEQNQKDADKKTKADAKRKKTLKVIYITGGVILAVLLAWLIIWLIMRASYNADITNPDKNEQGQAIGVTEADKVLERNDGDMNKVQEYFDSQIDKEKNIEKKNDIVIMSMQYYAESGDYERAIEASKQADLEKMTQWQSANYTMVLFNSYVSTEDYESAEYWNNYYNNMYPESLELDNNYDEEIEEVNND